MKVFGVLFFILATINMIEFAPNKGWQAEANRIDQEMKSEFNEDADKARTVSEIKEILHLLFDNSDDFRAERLKAENFFWASTPYEQVKNLDPNTAGRANVTRKWQKKLDDLLFSLHARYGMSLHEITSPLLALDEEELRWLRIFYAREERKPEGGTIDEGEMGEWSKAPLFEWNPNKGWKEEASKIATEEAFRKWEEEGAMESMKTIQDRLRSIFGNEGEDVKEQTRLFDEYWVHWEKDVTPDRRDKKRAFRNYFDRWAFQIKRALSGSFRNISVEKVYGPASESIGKWPLLNEQEKMLLRELIRSKYNFEDEKIGQLIGKYWKEDSIGQEKKEIKNPG